MAGKKKNELIEQIKAIALDLMKNPKKMIPSIVLAAIWLVFGIASTAGANIPICRFLYTLTYSNGGMFGGLFGAIGGIFGKAVFAACVTGLVSAVMAKKNPLSGIGSSMKGVFAGGLEAVLPVAFGGGLGILLYWFFNITASPVNCAVAVAGALTALMAMLNGSGLLFTGVFRLLRKVSKGKAPSKLVVTRVLSGFAAGFALSLPLTFVRSSLLLFLLGLVLSGGTVLYYVLKAKKPAQKMAVLMLLFVMISGVIPVSAGEYFDFDENVIPYRGRLTYTGDTKNKYGQPFPDLMDFDNDGYITWYDLEVQKELSHDPDMLDRPEHKAAGIAVAVVVNLAGAAAGAVGAVLGAAGSAIGTGASAIGEAVAEAAEEAFGTASAQDIAGMSDGMKDITKENPFLTRDVAGDMHVKDPVTGEDLFYTSNGDGTYTNPVTGAVSTEADMAAFVDDRIGNYDRYMLDEEAKKEAIAAQRAANQELSQYAKDAAADKASMKAQWEMEDRQRAYIDKLKAQYGYANEDSLRTKLANDQMQAEIEGYEQKELEGEYKKSQEYCETVEKVADTSIDVLAEVTGEEGKAVKDAYTFAKSTLVKGSEAYAEGRSVAEGLVQGAVEGGINVAQNHADSPTEKFVANVTGDAFKAGLDATVKGENAIEKMTEAAGKASLNTAVDVGFDMAGGLAKDMVGGDNVVKTVLGNDITADGAVDAVKTLAGDLTKPQVEKAFTTED